MGRIGVVVDLRLRDRLRRADQHPALVDSVRPRVADQLLRLSLPRPVDGHRPAEYEEHHGLQRLLHRGFLLRDFGVELRRRLSSRRLLRIAFYQSREIVFIGRVVNKYLVFN